jgi:hypothetical protein
MPRILAVATEEGPSPRESAREESFAAFTATFRRSRISSQALCFSVVIPGTRPWTDLPLAVFINHPL